MNGEVAKLFDFHAARRARLRAIRIGGERFLDEAAIEGLVHRLSAVTRSFGRGLVVGDRLPRELAPFARDWTIRDFDERECLDIGGAFDLAVSIYSLQSVNDLPGALIQIRRALNPDGLFLGTLFGGHTLAELRESFMSAENELVGGVSPHIAPFADIRDVGALLQRASYALPVTDLERLVVRYSRLQNLVRDLRAHGQTNTLRARRKNYPGRAMPVMLETHYARDHGKDGKLFATFETLYLTGWAPHESQQKPLAPGSAKARLSDVLKAIPGKV